MGDAFRYHFIPEFIEYAVIFLIQGIVVNCALGNYPYINTILYDDIRFLIGDFNIHHQL